MHTIKSFSYLFLIARLLWLSHWLEIFFKIKYYRSYINEFTLGQSNLFSVYIVEFKLLPSTCLRYNPRLLSEKNPPSLYIITK